MSRAVAGTVAAVLLAWALACYADLLGRRAFDGRHGNDFKHLYLGARLLADGESPYNRETLTESSKLLGFGTINPYVYLPFTGLAMRPLARLSPAEAEKTWFFLNHAFLWIGFFLLATSGSRRSRPGLLPLALGAMLCFASFATYRTLTAGQLNAALFACWALIWHLMARGRDGAAGSVAAFAALFKIAPGLLIFYFALARRWRALAGMIAAGLVLTVAGMIATGPGRWLEFYPLARDMGYGRSTWGDVFQFYKDPSNQALNSFFHHILAQDASNSPWLDLGPAWADAFTTLCGLTILGAALGAAFWRGRQRGPEGEIPSPFAPDDLRERALFAAFVLGSLLIPSLCWDHYMTIALAALLLLLWAPEMAKRPALMLFLIGVGWLWAIPWPFQAPRYRLTDLGGWWWLSLGQPPDGPEPKEIFTLSSGYGLGLALQSLKLWPTLALFVACVGLTVAPAPRQEKDREKRS